MVLLLGAKEEGEKAVFVQSMHPSNPSAQFPVLHGVLNSQAAARTARILLEPFPRALRLSQMRQGYFEEAYTTEKLQPSAALEQIHRNSFADLPYLL